MQHCDTLIFPAWAIPVEPRATVLTDCAVAIVDGRIADVLPAGDARARYQASSVVERPEHVLIPGLVNTHTHAAMTLLRGLSDDLPLEQWLRDAIWPSEQRWVSAEFVRDGTELAIAEMLQGGTTCFSDQYYFPEIVAQTSADTGVRALVATPVVDFATAWAHDASECLLKGTELVHDPFAEHPLISTCFAPHSTGTLSDEAFVELRVLADQLDRKIQLHLHETASEIETALRRTGKRPLQRLTELGLVNASLLVVHGVHMADTEIEQLANAGVSVAHCPKSNLKLASGVAPVCAYKAAGVNVSIGTDGAASNNTLDMFDEMRTAALLAKASSGDARQLDADTALRMATLDGAQALGLGRQIGSIEVGKQADLACVDLTAFNSQPVYDPLSQLVYTAQASQVSDVWVAGKQQLDKGTLTGIDRDDLSARTEEWRQRIAPTN